MSQQELLKKVIQALDAAGIEYMATGSLVSSLQGEPRSTHDIDLVVAIHRRSNKDLLKFFPPPDYYLDEESIVEAINSNGMFNLIEVNSGDKIDFWILTDGFFDQSRFKRRYREEVLGLKLFVSAPEDTILMKLRWTKLAGGSEKQFTDAMRVYEVQYEKLDMNYLRAWAAKLGVEEMLQRLQNEADIIQKP
jgi:hypothetical protein